MNENFGLSIEDIEEMKKMAGIGEISKRDLEKKWGDEQIKNGQPTIENPLPIPSINDFGITEIGEINHDKSIENLANRLNNKFGFNNNEIQITRIE
jgi:hypothetical protein